jgi:hypothetical protein
MSENRLIASAKRLSEIINGLDKSKYLINEAYQILRPILDDAVSGKLQTPGRLPHRTFFFGMYEDSLPAHYLNDATLMNAIGDFDNAWQQADAAHPRPLED